MIYFDASKVFALLLSCPRLDPFVTTQPSSDVVYIHTGCCYRKTYKAHVKKFGIDMLLPCVMAMDKTHIGMAGQLKMEPTTISHGLSADSHYAPPPKCHAHPWIHQSQHPAHFPSCADVDSEFNFILFSWIGQWCCALQESSHLWKWKLGNVTPQWNSHTDSFCYTERIWLVETAEHWLQMELSTTTQFTRVVFHPYVPLIVGNTEGHNHFCGHYTARSMEAKQLCLICECPSCLTGHSKSKWIL